MNVDCMFSAKSNSCTTSSGTCIVYTQALKLCIPILVFFATNTMAGIYPAASYSEIISEQGVIKVIAVVRHVPPGGCTYIEKMMWGSGGECPATTIDSLFIECAGRRVFIEPSVYNNLSNIEYIDIVQSQENDQYIVVIHGGNSDNAYKTRLYISNIIRLSHYEGVYSMIVVSQKTIAKSNLPDKIQERTIYYEGKEVAYTIKTCE